MWSPVKQGMMKNDIMHSWVISFTLLFCITVFLLVFISNNLVPTIELYVRWYYKGGAGDDAWLPAAAVIEIFMTK